MKPTRSTASTAIFALILITLLTTNGVSANPQSTTLPTLTMPVEHINYTITSVNGTLWAKIDGTYPIQINCASDDGLPMVYPMPPGTTNIYVTLNDRQISWSNYTAANPGVVHQTAIGDWWMIYSFLTDISEKVALKIHYEHPLQKINDSYLFLYDLNIAPYLSEQSPNSTAYFTVRMETNTTNLQVFTAQANAPFAEWKNLSYNTTTTESTEVVTFVMHSEYENLINGELPGDLVVMFSDTDAVLEFPSWVLLFLLAAVLVSTIALSKRRVK